MSAHAAWGDPVGSEHRLSDEYQQLKGRLHEHLLGAVQTDSVQLDVWSSESLTRYVEVKLSTYVAEHDLAVKRSEISQLVGDLVDELTGLGPLQPLLDDDRVTDIVVNGHRHVFADRDGRLVPVPVRFIDDAHVLRIIDRALAPIGRRMEPGSPVLDAHLPDGSRVHAIVHPVTLDGPCLSLRKFRRRPLLLRDLVASGSLTDEMAQLLESAVRGRCNLLLSGVAGAGTTTLLNALSHCIAGDERIVTIENSAELRMHHPHAVRLETQPPAADGSGEITMRMLVRNALRLRPDRILVGEIRDSEVIDVLLAMHAGHEGSMATIRACTPRDCLARLELLVGLAGFQGSERTLRQNVASAIDLIVQVDRLAGGRRCLGAIQEISGVVDGQFQVQDLFRYDADADRFVREAVQVVRPRLRRALARRARRSGLGSSSHV